MYNIGPTPYDVPVQDFVNGLYHLTVEAEDEFGNTDSQELTFSPPTATFVGCKYIQNYTADGVV